MSATDWESKTLPFPNAFITVEYTRTLPVDARERLIAGLIPREMEDRWYVRLRDGHVDFFRSWTGTHIYRISAIESSDRIVLESLMVNDDRDQWNPDAVDDHTQIVDSLIDRLLSSAEE